MKNLGLAYVHLVREPSPLLGRAEEHAAGREVDAAGLPVLPVLRARAEAVATGAEAAPGAPPLSRGPDFGLLPGLISEAQWKTLAAERVLETWGAYLRTPVAREDPGRAAIENVVKVLREAAGAGRK